MSLLSKIQCPSDLEGLDLAQLDGLAGEIREVIIRTVAANGGHLSSNLGVVELTLALLTVFNRAEDRLVWDVGHQCYAHKILTGRCGRFGTLRQDGGLAGFPRREESPYDAFNTGHSGTSISAGAGLLEGLKARGGKGRVVAVIGDGSMTSGLAFEGLNHAGHLKRDLIVVLNDNEMSISPNVGALSSYMTRLMTGHFSTRLREETEKFLLGLPGFGEPMLRAARRAEEAMKSLVIPGILFEELGFKYVGPLPGHEMEGLIQTLRNVRDIPRPLLVHVITRKGKGYEPAERDPAAFHGLGPFDVASGRMTPASGPPTYTEVFSDALCELAAGDPRIVAITAAMPAGTGLERFAERFPGRFHDVGIAEQHAVAFAAGMAAEGLRPVVAIYSTFLQRAYDQILHDVCLTGLPVVFALDRAGIVGEDGPTHQGLFDLSFLRSIPNMTVLSPRDEGELPGMLAAALSHGGPVALRYPRGRGTGAPRDPGGPPTIGTWEVLTEGSDLAILAVGAAVHPALAAARTLQSEGVRALVVNARSVKPLDRAVLERAAGLGSILTVEENVLAGGFGAAVVEELADLGAVGVRVRRLGIVDRFVEHGAPALLRRRYGLDAEGIAGGARELLAASRGKGGG